MDGKVSEMEAVQKKNKYEIDMCNGTIMDKLISFALPLMVSSILQLLFNAVDIIVVGRFTGSQALAAVGSTTALINMFVNLFIGVSLGANVLFLGQTIFFPLYFCLFLDYFGLFPISFLSFLAFCFSLSHNTSVS